MTRNPQLIHEAKHTPTWETWDERVTTINLGQLGADKPLKMKLPDDLAARFPEVTHLRLWSLDVRDLPALPPKLKVLEVRKCPHLKALPPLPEGLEMLVLEKLPGLTTLRLPASLPQLWDLSLNGCAAMEQVTMQALLQRAPTLRWLNLSGCEELEAITDPWPPALERIVLNTCWNLRQLPKAWPIGLRRLEIQNASALAAIPGMQRVPADEANPSPRIVLDYLNLRGCDALKHLPEPLGTPRTIFIHGSGLELPNELFGEEDDFNAAPGLLPHLESKRVADHEIKVILLGNGRCGKTSLARRLVDDVFDPKERSTHGIHFWRTDLDFQTQEGERAKVTLNVWDFAGQDLYHNTHRLFLQSKALFLICDTLAGDGADPETDGTDDDGLPPGWDIDRTAGYWHDLVKSLESSPGMNGPPPVLLVRTKEDRDGELKSGRPLAAFQKKCGETGKRLKTLSFSAKTGEGLGELKPWLAENASVVLGAKGRTEIAEGGAMLKQELRTLMQANEIEHEAAIREQRPARPPYPKLSLEDFHDRVRQHCPTGSYHEHPDLMLSLLHLSGFLYHSEEYLNEWVILDQRWVINGMYAAFDRAKAWPRLVANRGRCTAGQLAEWGWNNAGFDAEEQALFLNFMLSCGMAFELGYRECRGTEYVVPRALPEDCHDVQREAADYRAGQGQSGESVHLSHDSLSRDAVMTLLVKLGAEWRRSPVMWLWGGQFESFRYYRAYGPEAPRTFVHLNWTPKLPDSYGGTLTLTRYGEDASFMAAILNECRKLGGFKQVTVPVIEVKAEPELLKAAERADPTSTQAHDAPPFFADTVEIGISFAGDQPEDKSVANWEELPAESIERWPLALAAALRAQRMKVEHFRIEQKRPVHTQTPDRKAYLNFLVERDFMFVVISPPYLESEWCMYELMKIVDRFSTERGQDRARTSVGVLPDARFSQTTPGLKIKGTDRNRVASFRDYWSKRLAHFKRDVVKNAKKGRTADPFTMRRELESYAYEEWMACVDSSDQFERIVNVLKCNQWVVEPLREPVTPELATNWVIRSIEGIATALFDIAKERWAKGTKEDRDAAQKAFLQGLFAGKGSSMELKDGLKPKQPDAELEMIRRRVYGEYLQLIESGEQIETWQELQSKIARLDSSGA